MCATAKVYLGLSDNATQKMACSKTARNYALGVYTHTGRTRLDNLTAISSYRTQNSTFIVAKLHQRWFSCKIKQTRRLTNGVKNLLIETLTVLKVWIYVKFRLTKSKERNCTNIQLCITSSKPFNFSVNNDHWHSSLVDLKLVNLSLDISSMHH